MQKRNISTRRGEGGEERHKKPPLFGKSNIKKVIQGNFLEDELPDVLWELNSYHNMQDYNYKTHLLILPTCNEKLSKDQLCPSLSLHLGRTTGKILFKLPIEKYPKFSNSVLFSIKLAFICF